MITIREPCILSSAYMNVARFAPHWIVSPSPAPISLTPSLSPSLCPYHSHPVPITPRSSLSLPSHLYQSHLIPPTRSLSLPPRPYHFHPVPITPSYELFAMCRPLHEISCYPCRNPYILKFSILYSRARHFSLLLGDEMAKHTNSVGFKRLKI